MHILHSLARFLSVNSNGQIAAPPQMRWHRYSYWPKGQDTWLYHVVPNCTQLYPTPLRETRPETSLVQLGSLSRSDRLIEKLRATPSPKSVNANECVNLFVNVRYSLSTYIGCVTCVALPWRALCLGFLAFFPVWRNLSHDLNFSLSSGCSMSPCTTHTQRSVFSLFKRGIPVWCSSLHVTLSNWIN